MVGLCHVTCQSTSRLEIRLPDLLLPPHGQLEADALEYPNSAIRDLSFLSLSLWSGKIVVIIIRLQTTKNLQRAVLLVKSFILYGAAVKALHCDFVVKKFSC